MQITSAILPSVIVTGRPLEPGSASSAAIKCVDDRIEAVIGASPAALDSLQDLAVATRLADTSNLASTNVLMRSRAPATALTWKCTSPVCGLGDRVRHWTA